MQEYLSVGFIGDVCVLGGGGGGGSLLSLSHVFSLINGNELLIPHWYPLLHKGCFSHVTQIF